jgi:hypothetical protein
MLRVPGSINSKNGNRVQIIKKWNGQRPHIKLLIGSFCVYLSKEREEEQLQVEQEDHELEAAIYSYDIRWIDKLLQTPISDGRKYAIWRILVPYLRNVKRMSFEQGELLLGSNYNFFFFFFFLFCTFCYLFLFLISPKFSNLFKYLL